MKLTIKHHLLAGYRADMARINVLCGDYEAKLVNHTFTNANEEEPALKIFRAIGDEPLFIRCAEYKNEVDWENLPTDNGNFCI